MPLRQSLIALTLVFGTITPAFAQQSQLPATWPGVGKDEGVFLVTATDDGSRVVYFIAQNARHAILDVDLQVEQQMNPLWPIRVASRDEVLDYAEGSAIGKARAGLLMVALPEIEAEVAAEPESEVAAETEILPSTLTLRPGDNLTYIARDHGTTVQAILEANRISNPNRIYAGQSLVIPGNAVAEAPSEESVAAVEAIEAVAEETSGESRTYTVQRGDSAIGIARELGVDVEELLAANGVTNRNRIYAGQLLTVPARSS